MTQDQALNIMKTGVNIFLTGEPGSGKTYLVNQYVKYLRDHGVPVAITASTGIAATHISGMTIHSWSGIQIKKQLTKSDLSRIASNRNVVKRIKNTSVLIVDEVSMLLPEILTMVDQVCRWIKNSDDPFGGMQVVFVGDFYQLPPVRNTDDIKTNSQSVLWDTDYDSPPADQFAYDSPAWLKANPVVCYLNEQHRQEDVAFLSLLSAIRHDCFSEDHYNLLCSRKCSLSAIPNETTKLFTHNFRVDDLNNSMLAKIKSDVYRFHMSFSGPTDLVKTLVKNCLSPEILSLKIGAIVMFTKNNPKKGFYNGSLGKVIAFDKAFGFPVVELRNSSQVIAEPMEWTIDDADEVLAGVSQIPLRLAWAITVHKSQGMNLDSAVMDLSGVFEYGQGYVALSRVRTLSGLFLLGWNNQTFQVHPRVMAKDKEFRNHSSRNSLIFSQLKPDILVDKQETFINQGKNQDYKVEDENVLVSSKVSRQVNHTPTIKSGTLATNSENLKSVNLKLSGKLGYSIDSIRLSHINAYRPWRDYDDIKLTRLFNNQIKISDLAKIFGRQVGAIRSRLAKLGLIK